MKKQLAAGLLATTLPGHVDAKPRFACNLNGLSTEERQHHRRLTEQLLKAVEAKTELADGYGFKLPRSSWSSVSEWVWLESKCCPFFGFQLELGRDGGPLWLRLTGEDGTKAFIRDELPW